MTRALLICLLVFLLIACQSAPATVTVTSSTETPPASETPLPTQTATQISTLNPTPAVSPELLKEQASPLCENAFSALFEAGRLTAPFAVLKKEVYADAPTWEFSHQLPHMGSFSANDVQTIFCISETRTQTGTYTDGSAAYQLFWDVRAVSWPDGKVIGRNSFVGSTPPETKIFASGATEGLFPYGDLAAWVFDEVDHPGFLHFGDAVTTVAISPDGTIAAFGTSNADEIVDRDYTAKIFLFRSSDLEIISSLEGHQGMVASLAFSPDGKILASSGFDLFVKFWEVSTHKLLGQANIADAPNSIIFSPDGSKLAIASNLEVTFVDPASVRVEESVQGAGGNSLAFSPDGNHVYVNSQGSIKVIDTNASLVTLTFPDPFALIPTMSVSADGSIVSVTYESPEAVDNFVLFPDGAQIITYTIDRALDSTTGAENVRLATWDAKTGKYLSEVKFSADLIRAMKLSRDGKLLAIGNGDEVWLWDTASWRVKKQLTGHVGDIVDLAFTPDATKILSAGSDGTIRIWAVEE